MVWVILAALLFAPVGAFAQKECVLNSPRPQAFCAAATPAVFILPPSLVTPNTIIAIDGTHFATLAAGWSACPMSGCLILDMLPETLTSGINLNLPNVTLVCTANTVLKKGFSGDALTLSAAGTRVSGCTVDGNQASGFSGSGIVLTADSQVVDHNVVRNNGFVGIYVHAATGFDIHDNFVSGNLDTGIFGEATSAVTFGPGRLTNNYVDSTSGSGRDKHAISFHTTAAGSSLVRLSVSGNALVAGSGFCAEAFKGEGNSPAEIVFDANTCLENVANGDGGYSFSGVGSGTIVGNHFNSNGFAQIAGIEVAGSANVTVAANQIQGGAALVSGIALTAGTTHTIVAGNYIGPVGDALSSQGIYVGTTPGVDASGNVVSNNVIALGGAGQTYGIWLQSNNAAAAVNRTVVMGNSVIGGGFATAQGIRLERDAGEMDSTIVVANEISNVGQGIGRAGDTNTVERHNKFLNVTFPIVGTSGDGRGARPPNSGSHAPGAGNHPSRPFQVRASEGDLGGGSQPSPQPARIRSGCANGGCNVVRSGNATDSDLVRKESR